MIVPGLIGNITLLSGCGPVITSLSSGVLVSEIRTSRIPGESKSTKETLGDVTGIQSPSSINVVL